jgi:hypothetical protein
VQIHPEAIKRTFNVLRVLKDEYLGHFVSGAMLCLEDPNKFHEDVGFVGRAGGYRAAKLSEDDQRFVDVSSLESCMLLEALDPHLPNMYAAWWYCCIPVASIRTHGLAPGDYTRKRNDRSLDAGGPYVDHCHRLRLTYRSAAADRSRHRRLDKIQFRNSGEPRGLFVNALLHFADAARHGKNGSLDATDETSARPNANERRPADCREPLAAVPNRRHIDKVFNRHVENDALPRLECAHTRRADVQGIVCPLQREGHARASIFSNP